MYLNIAYKEENGVRNIANAGPPPPARDLSRTEPCPTALGRIQILRDQSQCRDLCGAESPSLDMVEVNRVTSSLQPSSIVPSPPAQLERMFSSTGEHLLPPRPTPPSPDEAAPGRRSSPPEKQSHDSLPATIPGMRRLSTVASGGGKRMGMRG
jgi:hypothetical protein